MIEEAEQKLGSDHRKEWVTGRIPLLTSGATLMVALFLFGCRSTKPPPTPPPTVAQAARAAEKAAQLAQTANWPSAAREWQNAADQYFLLNDVTNAALALHNLAQAQMELRQYDSALTNLQQAAEINDRLQRREDWFRNEIMLLQVDALARRTNALAERIDQLRAQIDEIRNPSLRATFLNELGLFQKSRGQLNEALETYQRAIEQFQSAQNRFGIATVTANQAQLFERQLNYPAAMDAWQAARREFEALAEPPGIARCLVGTARTLLAANQNLPRAEELLRQAVRNYRTLRDETARRDALALLAKVLEAQNKTAEAEAVRKESAQ